MQKGTPILRSALISGQRLELTYRDPSTPGRTEELHRKDHAQHNVELSTAADYDTPESLQLQRTLWPPESSPWLRQFPKCA